MERKKWNQLSGIMKSNVGKVNIFELCVSHLRQEGENGKIAVPLLSHYRLHFLQQKLNINDHHQKGHGGTTVQKKMPKNCNKIDRTLYIQKNRPCKTCVPV